MELIFYAVSFPFYGIGKTEIEAVNQLKEMRKKHGADIDIDYNMYVTNDLSSYINMNCKISVSSCEFLILYK